MNILHIIASVDPADGGPIEGIIRQWQGLDDQLNGEIVSLDPPDAPFLVNFPLKTHALGVRPYKKRSRSKLSRFGYTPLFVPWLREHADDYDLIVVNGLWSYASVGAARVLPRLNVPYVVYPHGMLDPWFRRTYPIKHALKQVLWWLFEGRLLHHAFSALFTTQEEMALAEGQFHGHHYQGRVVNYGTIDPPRKTNAQFAAFRAQVPELGNRPYILFLGRIHPKKGCDLLIRAWAALSDDLEELDLVIAGPDQTGLAKNLQLLAAQLGIDKRVHWPGMLTGAAKWGAFRGAEAFILPSHQENFGIAVAEALACGTPVLISDKVNIWREIKGDHAGLVASDDQAGVEHLLRDFLSMDAEAKLAMRNAARKCFSSRFDLSSSAGDAFKNLIASAKKAA
jgi:glycosyltransferase involved in cell wall biosynthesis